MCQSAHELSYSHVSKYWCTTTGARSDDPKFFFIDAQYRGMGDSSLTLAGDEEITIELLARDLLFLLENLGWKEVALCGHSMGGTSPHVEPRLLYQVMPANV